MVFQSMYIFQGFVWNVSLRVIEFKLEYIRWLRSFGSPCSNEYFNMGAMTYVAGSNYNCQSLLCPWVGYLRWFLLTHLFVHALGIIKILTEMVNWKVLCQINTGFAKISTYKLYRLCCSYLYSQKLARLAHSIWC